MKKPISSFSDLAGAFGQKAAKPIITPDDSLVYSTDFGRIKQNKEKKTISSNDGFAKIRRETKGRKGKGVITITGLGLTQQELKQLAKVLKKTCGTGGTVVDETIEIQGDKRELIKTLLEKKGFKVKFIGG